MNHVEELPAVTPRKELGQKIMEKMRSALSSSSEEMWMVIGKNKWGPAIKGVVCLQSLMAVLFRVANLIPQSSISQCVLFRALGLLKAIVRNRKGSGDLMFKNHCPEAWGVIKKRRQWGPLLHLPGLRATWPSAGVELQEPLFLARRQSVGWKL